MSSSIRFAIIANPRTGTNHFIELLGSHEEVTCHREVFHRHAVYLQEGTRTDLLERRDQDPLGFLRELYDTSPTRACGFKIFMDHNDAVLDAVLHDTDIRKIILYRPNFLAVYSSELIAQAEQRYLIMATTREGIDAGVHDGARTKARARFDHAQFETRWHEYQSHYERAVETLNGTGQHYLFMTYEDYLNESLFRRVFPFLGLSQPARLHTRMKKMNASDILSRFSNPEEALEGLRKSGRQSWANEGFMLWSRPAAVTQAPAPSVQSAAPRLIAFYLPQYHPIPENDEWWGKGFTEWRNVAKARPLFPGHYQPHLPADLGFYDLRLEETRIAQAELAREHGIGGFCYYHYWFNGRRLLERPLNDLLRSGRPDFPFCICWANENWTRRWDGEDRQLLLRMEYSEEDDRHHIRQLFRIFEDGRYLRVDGKPLFLVYRTENLPEPRRTAEVWREEARKAGIGELYLARVESIGQADPRRLDFDAAVEFAPDWKLRGPRLTPNDLDPGLRPAEADALSGVCSRNYIHRYAELADRMLRKQVPDYPWFRCVTPSWDNSARRQEGAIVFYGSTPEQYQQWLEHVVRQTMASQNTREKLIFVNAWNEWAEGNHLEPDQLFGRGYLEATRHALENSTGVHRQRPADAGAAALKDLEQQVARQGRQIAELERALSERGREVAEHGQALKKRQRQVVDLGRVLAEHERHLRALQDSASWRMTKPLRWGFDKVLAFKQARKNAPG